MVPAFSLVFQVSGSADEPIGTPFSPDCPVAGADVEPVGPTLSPDYQVAGAAVEPAGPPFCRDPGPLQTRGKLPTRVGDKALHEALHLG